MSYYEIQSRRALRVLFVLHVLTCIFLPLACQTTSPPEPLSLGWGGKIYAGDSASAAVVRSQTNESIACAHQAFDSMVCLESSDMERLLGQYAALRARAAAAEEAARAKPPAADESEAEWREPFP